MSPPEPQDEPVVAFKPLGWRQTVVRVYQEIGDDKVMLVAAGVTYYFLLALVPSLSVLVSIYGLFTDQATVNQQVALLDGILPTGGIDIIRDQLERLTSGSSGQLSLTLIVSLLIAFWSAGAGIRAMIDAMNIAYDVTERRPFIKLNLVAVSFTLGAFVAAVVFVGVLLVLPPLLHLFALDKGFEWLVRTVGYLLMLLIALVGLEALYHWGPHGRRERWHWVTPGALVAILGVTVVSVAFSWYAAHISNYNATYGSLGALVGFLTWIWLTVTIIIVGAEVNSELERHAESIRDALDAG